MEKYRSELEILLQIQEIYLSQIIELGLRLEHEGDQEDAFRVYKAGLEKTNKARSVISGTMLGLLEG